MLLRLLPLLPTAHLRIETESHELWLWRRTQALGTPGRLLLQGPGPPVPTAHC